jgi:osmoprotectant transport system permease protein
MDERIAAALKLLPEYLGWHVALSAAALVLGLAISLPLAVAASRSAAVRIPALGLASLAQTIPSLALLALFYPLLLALSALAKSVTGTGFPALGFLPSLLALTVYSMLPILRTGVAGLAGVDPAAVEAAKGVGMSDRQRLWQVELPLAAPVIMAGVRTSAVWTIGAATLSTPVGQTSLGNYIFSGLQTENWVFVLFGCAASAALALSADALLGLVETGTARRDRRRAWIGVGGLLIGTLLALAPLMPHAAAKGADGAAKPAYVVGAKNFSEQYLLAELMASRLEAAGATVTRKEDLGSAVAYRALAAGEIDVYVDYSGTLWANVLKRTDNPGREAVLAGLTKQLMANDGVLVLGSLGFENAYALAMRADRARALGVSSIDDLARRAPELIMGGDLEFFARPEWGALTGAYGLNFRTKKQFQPTFMYRALAGGEADVISAFSSDGRISADKLLILGDPRHALPPYDAVILISPKRAHDARLLAALRPLIGAIPVAVMQQANYQVDRDGPEKQSPAQAAKGLAVRIRR